MPAPSCPRLFEVEAMRNGRLSGSERVHFERHLSQCPACSRESRALDSLRRALRAGHTRAQDELHARRERTRLLAAFDGLLVTEPVRRPSRLWYAIAVACLAAAFAVIWLPPPAPAPAARALIRAESGAVWSRSDHSGRERIVLTNGTLSIRVTRPADEPGVLIVLPDGELEDIGTTFSVAVENGRTVRVRVQEGSVALRLRDQPPLALGAGDAWNAPARVPASVVVAPSTSSTTDSSPAPARSAAAAVTALASPSSRASGSAPARVAAAFRASEDFRAAVSALDAGHNADAAARFERFLEQHPRDPRGEDAAYLRVLSLKHAGDDAATKAAARRYLLRYPNGFRRREVESLM